MDQRDAAPRPERRKGRTFSFNLSFGKKPPIADDTVARMLDDALSDARSSPDGKGSASLSAAFDRMTGEPVSLDDPAVRELLERARADAATSPDGTGVASNTETFTIDLSDGKLRVNRGAGAGDAPSYEDPQAGEQRAAGDGAASREEEMWDRLHLIAEGKGAYPDTQRWHRRLSMATWIIAIGLPLAVLILTLATGQSLEGVVFMTFGAAIVAAMFRGSIRS
jgi:hypothetical protein